MDQNHKLVKIKRFDKTFPLPEFKTEGAAAFDLHARIDLEILPHTLAYVPMNVAIEVPRGYFLLLVARSSTHKKGLWMANGVGIMDPDFSGDEDEYKAIYYNFTDKPVLIEKGERMAQGLIIKREEISWQEVDKMENKTRGGIGTTGNN